MKLHVKRRLQTGLALFCSLVLAFSAIPVSADDIASLENKTSDLQSQLAGINQEMLAISNEISSTEMQVEITNSEIMRTQDSLTVAQENEARQYEDMKSRIKYMYESGNASLIEMLFSAENMTDFLNKADFIQNISDYDRNMLNELRAVQEDIAEKENILLEQQAALTDLQDQLEARHEELSAKAASTSTDLATFTAQLEQLRAEEAARQAAAAQAAAQAAAAAQASANLNGGSYDSTVVNTTPISVDASELDVFAAILQCEAYQDYDCLLAVATVIMNRLNAGFGNSITEIVYASGQFEPVWTGRLDAVLAAGPTSLSYQVAQDALNGARLAAVADCYYFLYAGATDRQGVNVGNNLFFQRW